MRPFIDFYSENQISPVTQDISDSERHFNRRSALYRHLGIPPGLIKGRSVIEFGPGSGYNSIHTSSLGPERYVLVDANPAGLESTKKLLSNLANEKTKHLIVDSLIEEFETDERFDIVLCEGVIPLQLNPQSFLSHIAKFSRPGGLVVITCMDNVSQLSEIMRRIVGTLLVPPEAPVSEKLTLLRPIFKSHLETLSGRSRFVDDWILDVIINPWLGSQLSISDAITTLDQAFDIYGVSPSFLSDWRWYKNIHGDNADYNQRAINAYHANLHNFIDYRFIKDARPEHINQKIQVICDRLFEFEKRFRNEQDIKELVEVQSMIARLSQLVHEFSPETALSIDDYSSALDAYFNSGSLGSLGRFAPLFGRGQQYLSFIRR